jgi:predicted alpha/beta hydrolase family esterase
MRLPQLALQQAGAEAAVVEYPSQSVASGEEGWWGEFHDSVADQVAALVAAAAPSRLTFVAKSLGTVALASIPTSSVASAYVEAIWLTPLFGREQVRDGAVSRAWPSLLVAGEADEFHDPLQHDAVREAIGARSLVLSRADHFLEVEGDVMATLAGFGELTQSVLEFVGLGS